MVKARIKSGLGWLIILVMLSQVVGAPMVKASNVAGSDSYSATVKCDLKEAISDGKFKYVEDYFINPKNYPSPANCIDGANFEIRLMKFSSNFTENDVITGMNKVNYRPATLVELLALGKSHPELAQQFLTVALGSVWVDPETQNRRIPLMSYGGMNTYSSGCSYDLGCGLNFNGFSMNEDILRFAAVPKTSRSISPSDIIKPVITITSPTKISNSPITNTTIRVTDNKAIKSSKVTIDTSSTARTSNLSCSQDSAKQVNCTIKIIKSGTLKIKAVDDAGNVATTSKTGYVINIDVSADITKPTITITAPIKILDYYKIENTEIRIKDNEPIHFINLTLDGVKIPRYQNYQLLETDEGWPINIMNIAVEGGVADPLNSYIIKVDANELVCRLRIAKSGDIKIKVIDGAGNSAFASEAGFEVKVPPSANEIYNYIVEPGDTLTSIAKEFKLKKETIMKENNISNPNQLRVGTTIRILPVDGFTHSVKSGETTGTIANKYNKYNVKEDVIIKQNLLKKGDILQPGRVLIIPTTEKIMDW